MLVKLSLYTFSIFIVQKMTEQNFIVTDLLHLCLIFNMQGKKRIYKIWLIKMK